MTVYQMAKLYYPKYWTLRMLNMLVKAGRLTQSEVDEIVNGASKETN